MAQSGLDIEISGPLSKNGAARAAPKKGDIVDGRFSLVREIARGGMGVVFEARHCFTGRVLALKFVPPELTGAELGKRRLLQEAENLGALRHPNIVELHDAGVAKEVGPYLAMEKLEGRTLDGILAARRTLGLTDTLHIARAIIGALTHAHQQRIVHRDIKPANIFVQSPKAGSESVKLIDFGIAGQVRAEQEIVRDRITQAGDLLGTLDYVAPEQLAQADLADPRSDQYSLAVVLFECLSGAAPSISDRMGGPARLPDLAQTAAAPGPEVIAAILKAMSPRVEDRFASIEEFGVALYGKSAAAPVAIVQKPVAGVTPGSPETGVSRRRHRRAPYIAPCRVVRENGSYIDGRSEDISEGGLLVVLPQSLRGASVDVSAALSAQGAVESVRVRFALPTTGLVVTVPGLVRWLKDGKGRAALGIEFDAPPEEVRVSIGTYVKLVGVAA